MCPTELGYDPALPACMRLLPIETREQTYSLAQWRSRPSTWVQLPLDVNDPEQMAVQISKVAETRTVGPTGVEMEAIVAAQTAAATIYDMCKAVQRDIVISRVRLLHKRGGKSGEFNAQDFKA